MKKENYSNISFAEAFQDDEKLLGKVMATIKEHRSLFERQYRDMGVSFAFYEGRHYGEWDEKTVTWRDEDINYDDRPRIVCNKVKPIVRQAMSKVLRYKMSTTTTPQSNEEIDKRSSKVSEQLLHHEQRVKNHDDKVEKWVKQSMISGLSFMKASWDPFASEEVNVDQEDLKNVEIKVDKLYKGDIRYDIVSPLNMIWDDVCDWEHSRFGIEVSSKPVELLKARYPEKKKKIHEISKKDDFGDKKGKNSTKAETWEIYYKPCDDFPEGGYAFGTSEVVLERTIGYPDDHNTLPWEPLIYDIGDEIFFSYGMVHDLVHPQIEYNKTKNIKVENENYAAAIKFLNPVGSNFDADLMTNEAGEVIDYAGDRAPGWSQPLTASQELIQSLEETKNEMSEISGITPTSQGKPPEGIRSGIAIQYLIENDDSQFTGFIRRMNSSYLKICHKILCLMKQYYENEDERYYKVIGRNKQYQLKKFKKADIKGNYDVILQTANASPLSKAYKMDTILQLIQYQILNPDDRPFISEALELGNLKGVYEDLQIDMLRAEKEIDKIIQGEPHELMPIDDHEIHIATKERYLKSEYDSLSAEQREAILSAIQAHADELQAQQPPMPPQGMPPEGMPQEPMSPEGAMPLGGEL